MATHRSGTDWTQIELGVEALFKDRYKGRKNKFKNKMFGKNNPSSRELIADNPPKGMSLDDWHKYLNYITSKKFANRSSKNKANRAKLPYSSNHGTRSYAASRYIEWEKTGTFPDLIEDFRTRHMKAGQWTNSEAQTRYDRMITIRESQEGQEIKLTDEQILGQVLGESRGFFPGRGRRLCSGASSSRPIGSQPPPPVWTQAAMERYAAASHQQVTQIYQHLQVPPPPMLDPKDFLDPEEDALSNSENATGPGGE